jgi:hypothetical protein
MSTGVRVLLFVFSIVSFVGALLLADTWSGLPDTKRWFEFFIVCMQAVLAGCAAGAAVEG